MLYPIMNSELIEAELGFLFDLFLGIPIDY